MSFPRAVGHVPGSSTGLVGDGVALLVDADPLGPLVASCRAALAGAAGGADAVLGALTSGGSPPDFVLAATEGAALRLVVGGRGQAEFAGGVAATITAAGGWLDHRLDATPDLRLSLADPARPIDPTWPVLPLQAGTVLAAALIVPALRAAPAPAPAPPGPGDATTVQAVLCTAGHLNAPFVVGACRVCGAPVPAQEPFLAPRPVLGVLVLESGDRVPVDREVLLGRAPVAADRGADDSAADADGPRVVSLPSPETDLSRTHARVSIDGWLVRITDLDSTNGTIASMPGQQGVRLRAHDPFVLVPGTVIDLAGEARIRFELP